MSLQNINIANFNLYKMYYSQTKQDEFLDNEVFNRKVNGFFLDIGAHDGITLSNTCFFEKNRKWNGICVEPLPVIFSKLLKNRSCHLVNGCIGPENGEEKFIKIEGYSEMLSGLARNYNNEHLDRIDKEISTYGGSKEVINVKSYNINSLLEELNVNHIDYCSIDVEGSEFEIIQTFDLIKFNISVFSIENNYNDKKLRNYLKEYGYILYTRLGDDDIFIKKTDFPRLKSKLSNFKLFVQNLKNHLRF